MNDDDLDLDLDLEPAKSAKPEAARAEGKPRPPAKAMPTRKPGFFSRFGHSVARPVGTVSRVGWNLRSFLLVLAVLVCLVLLAQNWAPVRFYFFGWAFELPKAIAFLIDVALGVVLTWLLLVRSRSSVESGR